MTSEDQEKDMNMPASESTTSQRVPLSILGLPRSKFALSAGIALLALCLSALVVGPSYYVNFLEQELIASSRTAGIPLSIEHSRFSLSGIIAERTKALLPTKERMIPVFAEEVRVNPSYLSLLFSDPQFALHMNAYKGQVEGTLNIKNSENAVTLQISADGIHLAEHSHLAALGIEGGTFGLQNASLTFRHNKLASLDALVQLKEVALPSAITLPPSLTGAPLAITLPPIRNLSVSSLVKLDKMSLILQSIRMASSLGGTKGSIRFDRNARGLLVNPVGELIIALEPDGAALIGPFLPLLSKNTLSSHTRKFSLTFRKGRALPEFAPLSADPQ